VEGAGDHHEIGAGDGDDVEAAGAEARLAVREVLRGHACDLALLAVRHGGEPTAEAAVGA
jgi:hypothetical protein